MARFRLSRPAQADVARILARSAQEWGIDASRRYGALLTAAILEIAAAPENPATRSRSELAPGLRSFHLRHTSQGANSRVKGPVHLIYFRTVAPKIVEVVRILHERMDAKRHLEPQPHRRNRTRSN